MTKIKAPNGSYTGVSATVAFCNGIGFTTDKHLIEWFRERGYEVEEEAEATKESEKKALEEMSVEELMLYAQDKNIELGQATTQAGILKKIKEAEVGK